MSVKRKIRFYIYQNASYTKRYFNTNFFIGLSNCVNFLTANNVKFNYVEKGKVKSIETKNIEVKC